MTGLAVALDDILAARDRIAERVRRTSLLSDPVLTDRFGVPVAMKAEHRQETGSFKLRGASNALLSLPPERLARGVVTASTGNHGRALAHAARLAGVRAVVCLSRLVPANKIAAIAALGAELRIAGASQDEAMAEVARAAVGDGLTAIPPFDDPAVVAGQGTLGLEIAEDCPEAATVLVPLSGGGLAAGVAVAVKALRPGAKVIGVTMETGAAMAASLAAGRPVEVVEGPSLADSLGGGIGLENRVTFPICRALLDGAVLVSEAEIAAAIRHLVALGETVEGAAAVGTAALLAGKVRATGPVVTILSGGNIDPALHARILAGANGPEAA
ncbi:hydroxyectoine utilization dehydratase EutB [Paracoccus sp. Z118]|uniref:hydroxyectoine utilization dehydratase EutB n=1 Tax=Paracoccus sp. Z118 TaxID=2851017 RepID=UPI001C2BC57C|nr:hydroxyectoine utilization dehydratase EutB [Paracoccus sp. Z118]MBV0890356.1 hydroxyectoine utilization dehydratase EutB [Paracoccus sp. Z118]